MLSVVAFAALCYISQAASKIEASWSFCTGSDATECAYGKFANISGETFTPNPPPVGQNFSIIGSGYSMEAIQDPSYEMHIQDGAFVNQVIKEDGCLPYEYKFPLNDGVLYYNGITCPIAVGPVSIDLTAFIASKAPDGTATTTLKLYDQPKQKGNCVLCTVTTLKITG
mmetsp:Transcript_522/g.443  ORF Transcript_522/g.443 Transcript_522/m.443 type:complete len:169 (+) Transcript_522:67-573(+)|eukprot:CAMPEP_0201566976 /NCGR_PEP_ID=MMETSP0190_2-20130828/7197_1 /ASSEMBLY_ACC=CAM_ASM_000263 /TAXON_ID=37353 /ORGANISM="Rosalina sp." /LENGTH=168 /DNA_ID=CAMNT_0047986411 /DNA_START=60 /DNA_END=566 /DNA_ORIENTATION=+